MCISSLVGGIIGPSGSHHNNDNPTPCIMCNM